MARLLHDSATTTIPTTAELPGRHRKLGSPRPGYCSSSVEV
jgi:hypothetical protein